MLIVCPNCATSYMVEPSALGSGGRTVRCARCKTTWFASWQKQAPEVNAFAPGVIAEAEAQSGLGAAEGVQAGPAVEDAAAGGLGAEPANPEPAHGETEAPETHRVGEPAPEPVALEDAPSLVPPVEHDPLGEAGRSESDSQDVESYAARRQRLQARRKQERRSSRWTAAILLLFAINVALIGDRNDVVRYLPQTASLFAAIGLPVNLRHLSFENVQIVKEQHNGVGILMVKGDIVSTAKQPIPVPRLRFAARNAAGQEVYTWTALPTRSILGPGEKLAFHSRLASPPADAKNVMVRFFDEQDAAAAAK